MTTTDDQLADLEREYDETRERAHRLAEAVDADRWQRRPAPDRWSMAECIQHLNLTSQAYVPLLTEALVRGRALPRFGRGRYRRDVMGWLLCRSLEPPVRWRMKTMPAFVPGAVGARDDILAEFDRLQGELTALLREARGMDLNRLRITSPFSARMRYNVYSAFRVIPVHQRRHLWQAEQG